MYEDSIRYAGVLVHLFLLSGIALLTSKRGKNIGTWCLLCSLFFCGTIISKPTYWNVKTSTIYSIGGRCEELLSNHACILSIASQRFYVNYGESATPPTIGDSLFFNSKIYLLSDKSQPGEFSYARYLRQKETYYKLYPLDTIQQRGHSENLYSYFQKLRTSLCRKIDNLIPDTTCAAILKALCLGDKNDLDSETRQLFATTGTIHLLAVSGLHTGAIFLLMGWLFRQLGISPQKYRPFLIILLWAYACLTGLSPSVIRAATILSFITIGQIFKRDYTPLNSIAAAAFLTLLIQPQALHSISFLMSYSAYTGIILIYPYLEKLPGKLPSPLSKIYALLCISIAAQIPTLPLTAYYFHTVSLNSFLINIVAVPLGTILLYSGVILLLLPAVIGSYLTFIPIIIYETLHHALILFNHINLSANSLYPTLIHLTLFYSTLVLLMIYLSIKEKIYIKYGLISITLLLVYSCIFNLYHSYSQEIVIFHTPHHTCILLNNNGTYCYLKNDTKKQISETYTHHHKLDSLPSLKGIIFPDMQYTNNRLQTATQQIYIADRQHTDIKNVQTLIITGQIYPEQLFKHGNTAYPTHIITDGSASRYVQNKWESFCLKAKITLTRTDENGSITLKLK